MKKTFLVIGIILSFVVLINAQAQRQEDKEKQERLAREGEYNNRVDALRNNGKQKYIRDRYKKDRIFLDVIRPLYRDLTDEEKVLMAPNQEATQKYSQYFNQKNSGIIKLIIDKGCDGGTEVVVADPQCEKYRMPGAGSSYSFRSKMYRTKRLADITFTGKHFDTDGLVKHGILMDIGDIPLDKVNLKTKKLETLVTFQPVSKYEDAEKMSNILRRGVQAGDLLIGSLIKVKENKTYAMRSIAYKTKVYRRVQDTTYDEFDFDERDDVIIAFRVVRYDPNESVTIVWKQLKKKRAPKIALPKKYQ